MSFDPDTCTSDEVVEHLLESAEKILRANLVWLGAAEELEDIFTVSAEKKGSAEREKTKKLIHNQLALFEHWHNGDCDRENLLKGLERIRDVLVKQGVTL